MLSRDRQLHRILFFLWDIEVLLDRGPYTAPEVLSEGWAVLGRLSDMNAASGCLIRKMQQLSICSFWCRMQALRSGASGMPPLISASKSTKAQA